MSGIRTEAPEPQESLDVIRQTLIRARRKLLSPDGPVYKVWGLAWAIAFGGTHALWLNGGQSIAGWGPGPLTGLLWSIAGTVAGIFTYVHYASQKVSSPVGARFGWVWPVALGLGMLLTQALGLPGYAIGVMSVYTVALLYIAMGAAFFDNLQLATGLWIGVANVIGTWMGPETYSLVMALLGGGGLLGAGFAHDRLYGRGAGGRGA